MSKIITGLFESPANAANAVEALLAKGVGADCISVLASESVSTESFGVETSSKVGEGAAIGAGVAGGVGALIAGFTAVGALASTGVGLIAVGPLVAALAGAGAGAATGGVLGGLVGLAIPEHEIKHYEDALHKGSVLVGVDTDCPLDSSDIKDVFKAHSADKISHA
ncbi:MAG: hypothetical protein DHS20C14_16480 [Phycisphaeraceae bacterium]|nr:MAG: hypothetical protein DHS20C14_16480 [Phycisphaeraceae bacterium]